MKRPNKEDYMTGHPQMDYDTDLAMYYKDLEKYIDYLEDNQCSSEKMAECMTKVLDASKESYSKIIERILRS